MSVRLPLIALPRRFQHQQLGGTQLDGHVGELEADALELADRLAELHAIDRPLLGEIERALGAAEAGRRHLQARRAEPGVGNLEALVHLAEHRGARHAAIVELQDAVVVAAVRDVAVTVAHGEPGMPLVDQERGQRRARAARSLRLPVAANRITKSAWSA